MTRSRARSIPAGWSSPPAVLLVVLTSAAFLTLFGEPLRLLVRDWWNDPEAGHGLLLGPVAVWLAWKSRPKSPGTPNHILGLGLLVGAILIRYLSGLAAELYTMRMSMVLGLAGLTAFYYGFRQVLAWWLPFTLLVLSVPLPEVVRGAITLPLQFRASRVGAALLEWRDVPVRLTGNIIMVPGHQLFVTEACSGLRSLTALVSLSVLLGALTLRTAFGRMLILVAAVVVAIAINAVRVFLTGFLVVYVDPKLADGFMHVTEGWLLFLVSLLFTGAIAWILGRTENWILPPSPARGPA